MNTQLNVLIVEDTPSDQELYMDSIYNLNKEYASEDIEIIPKIVSTLEEARHELLKDTWSAAFIDLKLSKDHLLEAEEGNEIVEEIFEQLRFPITILSNTPQEINPKFKEKESVLLQVHEKGEISYEELIKKSIELNKTGVMNILGGKGLINDFLNKIFWNHINMTLPFWLDQQSSGVNDLEKVIMRYTLSHLNESLMRDELGNFEKHHPSEFYIVPPINEELFTGDLIEYERKKFIVLNPACDLVIRNYSDYVAKNAAPKRKSSCILICEFVSLETALGKPPKQERKSNLTKSAENFIQDPPNRFHFLPPFREIGGVFIDFQLIKTIPFDSDIKLIATVSAPFLKDIVSRFSFYYSRQGAPEIDFNIVEKYFTQQ